MIQSPCELNYSTVELDFHTIKRGLRFILSQEFQGFAEINNLESQIQSHPLSQLLLTSE